ncbi:MAG: response regulator [Nitrospirae bacterium]|nr:response regulator [Nitrospirota bacterium]
MAETRTVLVVDDSGTTAKQLSKILEASGRYTVIGRAADGLEALKAFQASPPDLVCMDVLMPNLDGVQTLRMMRQICPEARVVMISSVGGVADKLAECLKAGATNVISKPFDPENVLKVLDSI